MMRVVFFLSAGIVIVACSSSTDGESCADIVGNWEVTSVRTSGDCPAALDGNGKSTIAIAKNGDGSYGISAPGSGGSCSGTLDSSCRFTSNCEDRNAEGKVTSTVDFDYRFSSGTFTGSTINAALPPLVPNKCTASYKDEGRKL